MSESNNTPKLNMRQVKFIDPSKPIIHVKVTPENGLPHGVSSTTMVDMLTRFKEYVQDDFNVVFTTPMVDEFSVSTIPTIRLTINTSSDVENVFNKIYEVCRKYKEEGGSK